MKIVKKIGFVLLAAMFVTMACNKLEEPFIDGAEKECKITQFKVGEVEGVIDQASKTVQLDFEGGTDVSHLTPTITISQYASIEPASGVPQDFTVPVSYLVTAFNGDTTRYVVTAVVHDADNEKSILSFVVDEVVGVIDETAMTVTLTFPHGTDVTQLVPTIEVSEGATIDPTSGVAQDFTEPVDYTVTAINGTTATYTVTAVVESEQVVPTGKTVLVKDFTGVLCQNCPAAAEYAHELQQQIDEDHIIILGVHAGDLAHAGGNFHDFTTEEGTAWYGNNNSNPLFSVDHVALTSGQIYSHDQLNTPIRAALEEDQTFELRVHNAYDEASRRLEVMSEAIAVADVDGDLYVTVCLVEDGIVGWQRIPGGVDREYVFRNVFRGTLNGADGEAFLNGHADINERFSFTHEITLDDTFDADQCYILTYVYDRADGKILQSAMVKIM